MAGGLYGAPRLLGGARRDEKRTVARVHPLGRDRLALRLGQAGEAQLAYAPVARQLVQQFARERDAPATRADVVVAMGPGGLHAQDAAEVSRHGAGFARRLPFPAPRSRMGRKLRQVMARRQ